MSGGRPASVITMTTRRRSIGGPLVIALGVLLLVVAGVWIVQEQQQRARVIIATRDIPMGAAIGSDDVAVIEIPAQRPDALRGMEDLSAVIGTYATVSIPKGMLLRSDLIQSTPVRWVVFPNGQSLADGMVAAQIPIKDIGIVQEGRWLNIGFQSSDPLLCDRVVAEQGGVLPPIISGDTTIDDIEVPSSVGMRNDTQPRYACRWVSGLKVLYVDRDVAYVAMTPAQHLVWQALRAGDVAMWYEAYNADQRMLKSLDRRYASEQRIEELVAPSEETTEIEPRSPQPAAPPPQSNGERP